MFCRTVSHLFLKTPFVSIVLDHISCEFLSLRISHTLRNVKFLTHLQNDVELWDSEVSFISNTTPGGPRVSFHFINEIFPVFHSQMGHPSMSYVGRPQLHLPSSCRAKACPLLLHDTPRTKRWSLHPDVKSQQAFSSQLQPASEFSFHFWHLGFPGLSGSGILLFVLSVFCPVSMCLQQGRSGSPLDQSALAAILLET